MSAALYMGDMARTPDPEKQDAILKAATKMFLARGYEGTSVDAVADLAGVARRTVYNRYVSKEALFDAVVERVWSTFSWSDAIAGARSDTSARAVVMGLAAAIERYWRDPTAVAFLRLVICEGARNPRLVASYADVGKQPVFRALLSQLKMAAKAGHLTREVAEDPTTAAYQLIGLVNERLLWPRLYGRAPLNPAEREVVLAAAVATFLARFGSSEMIGRSGKEDFNEPR